MYILYIVVCLFSFLSVIVLSVLRLTDSDYSFGIFKFLSEMSGIWRKNLKIRPGVCGLPKPPSRVQGHSPGGGSEGKASWSSWVLSILRPILNEISCLYFCSWHIGKTLWFWVLYIKFSCQYYIKVNQTFYTENQNTFTLNKHFKYLCIYVSVYLCIYVSVYLCIYVSVYLCIYVSM